MKIQQNSLVADTRSQTDGRTSTEYPTKCKIKRGLCTFLYVYSFGNTADMEHAEAGLQLYR